MHTYIHVCLYRGVCLIVRGGSCLGVLYGGYLSGRFCSGGCCPFPLLSEYIRYNRKLNITFNFRFHMYEKDVRSVTSRALGPLPLSQTFTLSWTPSPSSVTYFMDGPYAHVSFRPSCWNN